MSYYHHFARHIAYAALALALTCVGGFAAPVQAGTVDLSAAPPDLNTTVAPNIALTFDDSGSMSFGYMPDNHTSCQSDGGKFTYHGYNSIYYDPNKSYPPPLKENGSEFPDVPFTAAPGDGFHDYLGGFGSGTVNLSKDYKPTLSTPNGSGRYVNTTISSKCIPSAVKSGKKTHAYYTLANGTSVDLTTITSGATVDGKTRTSAEEQQNFANWYSYYRTRNLMTKTAITRAFGGLESPIRLVWQTIWGYNSKTRPWSRALSPSDSIGPYQDILNADGSVAKSGNKPAFFSWLLALRSYDGTPDREATQRVGNYFTLPKKSTRLGKDNDPYWNGESGTADTKELACRQNYHVLVTDGYWNGGTVITPVKQADKIGQKGGINTPDGRAKRVVASSIYWNVTDTFSKSLANIAYDYWATDLAPGIPDRVAPYLADTSTSLWKETVDPADPWANEEIYFNPKNDPATWQHLTQFVVTLGVDGKLAYPGDYTALRKGDTKWPKAVANDASAIDDMWRASVVSRGEYFSASDPAALTNRLTTIINNVASRAGSAVAGTVSSGVWTTKSVAYQGSYNSTDWSGTVKAFEQNLEVKKDVDGNVISSRTVLGDELWDANCLLTGGGCKSGGTKIDDPRQPSTRVMFTSSDVGAGNGVAFQFNNLSASEQLALNTSPATNSNSTTIITDGLGQDRLDWLRGDRTKEQTELRGRGSVMGAVIRSQPMYVAYPDSGYRDNFPNKANGTPGGAVAPENAKPYEDFVALYKDRTPILYVGANDGMLHAIRAKDGKELFTYVPESVYWRSPPSGSSGDEPGVPNLSKLTAKINFAYSPTVDNTPVTRDVFFGAAWHTLLVGTLGMGGRGVYALDVTNPGTEAAPLTESAASSTVLWEFNSSSLGGDDLGYTYGQPEIARLATGKWAVLVPGGYFPEAKDDPNYNVRGALESFSSLFVLDAQTGALIREIKTSDTKTGIGTTSHGLSTPVLGDYQSDQVDDVAFAGDLDGNLWRFDLSSTDTTKWQVDLVYKGKSTQPITAKPRLFPDPVTNQFIVLFGTGKYLGTSDRVSNNPPIQAVYGIREQGASGTSSFPKNYYPIDSTKLATQNLVDKNGIRYLTNHTVLGSATGWVIALDTKVDGKQTGERVVQRAGAIFTTNQALINTLVPGSNNDPCNPDRKGGQFLISSPTGRADDGIPSLGDPLPPSYDPIPAPGIPHELPPVGCVPGGNCGGSGSASISDSGSEQPIIVEPGGCRGVTASGLNIPMSCWRRRSWKVLLDHQP